MHTWSPDGNGYCSQGSGRMVRPASLDDVLTICARNYYLILRRTEAQMILVATDDE